MSNLQGVTEGQVIYLGVTDCQIIYLGVTDGIHLGDEREVGKRSAAVYHLGSRGGKG